MVFFYFSGAVACVAAAAAMWVRHPIHALLYLVVSFLAIAVTLMTMGAFFLGALEVVVYAGAIMVLFVFVLMMLPSETVKSTQKRGVGHILVASLLSAGLLWEWITLLSQSGQGVISDTNFGSREIALSLFGTYALGIELASFLLLAGLIAAYHIASDPQVDRSK